MAEKEKKRGVLLTIWLVLMLIGNFLTALSYLLLNTAIASLYPDFPSWIFYIYALLSLANVLLVIFLFRWKKWAFYGFCISASAVFFMNLLLGVGSNALLGLMGPVILYLIMRSSWNLFE